MACTCRWDECGAAAEHLSGDLLDIDVLLICDAPAEDNCNHKYLCQQYP